MYQISKDSGIPYPVIHRIGSGDRKTLTVATAEALAKALGLKIELRPDRRAKKGG